jgi:hypothetical protein
MTEVFEDYAEVTVLVSRRLIEDMVRDGQTAALEQIVADDCVQALRDIYPPDPDAFRRRGPDAS